MAVRFSASDLRQQIQFPHDSENRFQIHSFSFLSLQPSSDTPNSVGLFAFLLTFYNQVHQPLILRHVFLALSPIVVAAAGDLKDFAHCFNTVFPSESLDHSVFQLHLFPTSNRKFRSKSTCMRNSVISLFRLASSSSGFFLGLPLGRGTIPWIICRCFLFCLLTNPFTCFLVNP